MDSRTKSAWAIVGNKVVATRISKLDVASPKRLIN
tara:strand:- start:1308 stop:1412 length:105 start_codon:yes stop_codon:yes gene_type:complete